ncbi:MAG: tRNA nucleotidyltransferase/poly(A) polymerase [Candidatus Atelocyanobacterium thalassa isolate SIO64986]|uniref:tRNA nucleotidyltransferase/poly(A) polymerase n=1 Tax=Candidatus Atelocyanobacterium thalassa isolate SIO64986 TaxID=1527444 RepID=A0A086CH23_9CHRO|nr:MAG: tRNA nucleotidyltransferase/poly(A) polymerase [Candidatus Atelocyanobacterium thalassa isolate SIO64986]
MKSIAIMNKKKLLNILGKKDLLEINTKNSLVRNLSNENLIETDLIELISSLVNHNIWQLIKEITWEAEIKAWDLYIVGGVVRDLFLVNKNKKILTQDIDLVVDGNNSSLNIGAGIEIAQTIKQRHPEAKLVVHYDFKTASLSWNEDKRYGSIQIDIATSRTEIYPYPAANPKVQLASIKQDLSRRDFTINALAIKLTSPERGKLLDLFMGLLDLKKAQIKVLHPNSFIEDPTRIYRAVRFAIRLNFNIEANTIQYIYDATKNEIYDKIKSEISILPSLTIRLKNELRSILGTNCWRASLELLSYFGALNYLHPKLTLNNKVLWQMRYAVRFIKYVNPHYKIVQWLLILEILLSSIPQKERNFVATNLQLPSESIKRLSEIQNINKKINQRLSSYCKISDKVKLLNKFNNVELILVAAQSKKEIRSLIWQYFTRFSKISSPLSGHDLKKMGYLPGPKYKKVLSILLDKTLDREIRTRKEAEVIVQQIMARRLD